MGQRVFNDTGAQMLATLPPFLQNSDGYQAVIKSLSEEIERAESFIETTRAQFFAQSADELLVVWEFELRLPIGGYGQTIDQRRAAVEARLLKLTGEAEGREWEADVTAIVGPGWTYLEHDPANPSSPAWGTVLITLPFQTGTSVYAGAQAQIRDVTPAHLQLSWSTTANFQVDESALDVTPLQV